MKKTHMVEVVVSHLITFDIDNGNIIADEKEQIITIEDINIRPGLELSTFKGKAYYSGQMERIFAESYNNLAASLSKIVSSDTDTQDKPNNEPSPTKPQGDFDEGFVEKSMKEEGIDVKDEEGIDVKDEEGIDVKDEEGIDVKDEEDEEKINESIKLIYETIQDSEINNKKIPFMVKTNKLKFTKIVELDEKQQTFDVKIVPSDIKNFVNYIESRKIKIFVDDNELFPKEEFEMLKTIFPYVDIELTI